jgi:hypothetical protein
MFSFSKKPKLDGTLQIAAHSGDAETMTFSLNLPTDLSIEEKKKKVEECFALIQARRDWTHEQMEEIRRKAREENEQRLAAIKAVPTTEGT